ncbi:hypothetical protein BdWA1_002212 [Babesia duncani]|uniref:Uncharacterized protein n=1 Tax=Babesia duncani TaxID=323732 RepID=A0AAD9PM75_9APIC|nr:hypothetical protein BdWA1_002212 [Babesia duncani]
MRLHWLLNLIACLSPCKNLVAIESHLTRGFIALLIFQAVATLNFATCIRVQIPGFLGPNVPLDSGMGVVAPNSYFTLASVDRQPLKKLTGEYGIEIYPLENASSNDSTSVESLKVPKLPPGEFRCVFTNGD